MSGHSRATVREAVVALLSAGGTDAGPRVYDSPTDARTAWPAITVEDAGEQQQVLSGRGPGATVRRVLLLDVTAEVQQVAGYAARRDKVLAQVETLLAAFTLPGLQVIKPAGYMPDQLIAAERPLAAGRQRFEVTYVTTQGAPGAMAA